MMVQLPKATDFAQPPLTRRHVESPQLWTVAIAGSVGAHLLLLAFTVPLVVKVATPQSSSAPVPIELVELASTGASASGTAQSTDPSAIAIPNTTPLSSPTQSSNPTSPTESPSSTDSASILPDNSDTSQQSSRDDNQGTGDNNSSRNQPPVESGEPSNNSSSQDAQDTQNSQGNQGSQDDSGGRSSQDSQDSTTSPGQPNPNQPPTNTDGNQSNPDSSGENPTLPGVNISQNAVPASITATVTYAEVPLSENPRDIPDQIPAPLVQSQEFVSDPTQSLCTITPETIRYLGETVSMQVEVDDQGNVVQTFLRDPMPASQEYGDLAQCLIKTWEFQPAISGGQAIASDHVIVSITISQ